MPTKRNRRVVRRQVPSRRVAAVPVRRVQRRATVAKRPVRRAAPAPRAPRVSIVSRVSRQALARSRARPQQSRRAPVRASYQAPVRSALSEAELAYAAALERQRVAEGELARIEAEIAENERKRNEELATQGRQLAEEERSLPPFQGVVQLVRNEVPSEGCRGDGRKTIPFLNYIADAGQIKHFCRLNVGYLKARDLEATAIIDFEKTLTALRIKWPHNFARAVSACKPPLAIVNFALAGIGPDDSSHANLIIIDKNLMEVERFEPHGETDSYDSASLDTLINKALPEVLPGFRYIAPLDYCPRLGPQSAHPESLENCQTGGFCAAWSMLYGHLRLLNPAWPRSTIVKRMIVMVKEVPFFLKKYITYVHRVTPSVAQDLFKTSEIIY